MRHHGVDQFTCIDTEPLKVQWYHKHRAGPELYCRGRGLLLVAPRHVTADPPNEPALMVWTAFGLTCVVVEEADVAILLSRDADGQGGMTQHFVDLTGRVCGERAPPLSC